MILEMRKEYKEKMCLENHTYRICWMLCEELIDIIGKETPISEDFKAYLVLLEELLASGDNRHSGSGEKRQFWSTENSHLQFE